MRSHPLPRSRGFTILELLVICVCVVVFLAGCMPSVNRARRNAQQIKDGTQLRAIMQGFLQFAAANRNHYPTPTRVDRFNDVEGSPLTPLSGTPIPDEDKNRTGAILSVAIFNNLFTPEVCVSPGETGNVRIYDEYQYLRPDGANTPGRATYDPAFNGTPHDPTASYAVAPNNVQNPDTGVSHNSYAHNCIAFGRAVDWTNTSSATTPIWANRGPVYENDTDTNFVPNRNWQVLKGSPVGDQSNAVLIWGTSSKWHGNIAFADSYVSFEQSPQPQVATFTVMDANGQPTAVPDNIFVDEHFEGSDPADHAGRRNAYLRQWKRGIPQNLDPDKFDYATHLAPTADATGFAYTD